MGGTLRTWYAPNKKDAFKQAVDEYIVQRVLSGIFAWQPNTTRLQEMRTLVWIINVPGAGTDDVANNRPFQTGGF